MARDADGSTDRIDWANPWNQAGNACSFSFWLWLDTLSGNNYFILSHASGDAALGSFTLWSFSLNELLVSFRQATTHTSRLSTTTLATGEWQHYGIGYDASETWAGISIYRNGVDVAASDGGRNTNGSGAVVQGDGSWSVMGRITDDARNSDGRIASVAAWDRKLSAGEFASLAAWAVPSMIPGGLKFAPDMDGFGTSDDPISGNSATFDGTTKIDHPGGLIYPSSGIVVPSAVAAPVGAIMNQLQGANLGADLYNGTLL